MVKILVQKDVPPLSYLRIQHGYATQKALADMVGVTKQRINQIERNTTEELRPAMAYKIAGAFGLTVEQLWTELANLEEQS